jgi:glycerol-1-phosphate dehydrogenase [NAD(P)+]
MSQFLFERYLRSFGRDGRRRCSCGQLHTLQTRGIVLGDGVSQAIPECIRTEHGERTVVWVLSDANTEEAAGEALKRTLRGLPVTETVLPAAPRPECTQEQVDRLEEEARKASTGLVLSVGSGTLCDLGKEVSTRLGVPNWGLMTAPSMDAHASGTANLKTPTGAISHPITPCRRVFCDTEVLRRAPQELFLAGLGDQLAKLASYLDWRLGAWVFAEHICLETAEASLQSGRLVLEAMRAADDPPGRTRLLLADALLTSGLCMQTMGHSRSAASAEHTASHFWEVAHLARNPRLALHGLLVGAASALVHRAYREFFGLLPGLPLDVSARVEGISREPAWQDTLEAGILPYRGILESETKGRAPVTQTCRQSLERFAAHRSRLQQLAGEILGEQEEGLRLLGEQGFPFDLREYGLSPDEVLLPFRYIRHLRNRTSAFDLMHLLGVEKRIYRTALAGNRQRNLQ